MNPDLGNTYPWGVEIPAVPAGAVGQVVSQLGASSTGFALDGSRLLTYNADSNGKLPSQP